MFVCLTLLKLSLVELCVLEVKDSGSNLFLVVYMILNKWHCIYTVFSYHLIMNLTWTLGGYPESLPSPQNFMRLFIRLFDLFLLYLCKRDLAYIDFVALQN